MKRRSKYFLRLAKTRGSNANKYNRAAKLYAKFDELEAKFTGMVERGIRSNTEQSRLALAVLLMMHTGVRVGNEASAEGYMTKPHPMSKKKPEFVQTFGLTTMKREHIRFRGTVAFISFLGKKQVDNYFRIDYPWSIYLKILLSAQNSTLFGLTDYQINAFIKKSVGTQFSAKDFRTMRANRYAEQFIYETFEDVYETKKELRIAIKSVFDFVSEKLNNTPGVCKRSYIHDGLSDYLLENYSI